jgi:hypothetical protein
VSALRQTLVWRSGQSAELERLRSVEADGVHHHTRLGASAVDHPSSMETPGKPRWRGRKHTDGPLALPADLLREQSIRIQLIYAVGVILWAINLVMDTFWAPQGDRGPYRPLIETSGMALAAATASFARFSRARNDTKVDVGVAFMVPHALGLALLNSWAPQSTTSRPLSGITVLILIFGMLAPSRPAKMLAAGSMAASMDLLGVWVAHLRGLPVPSPINTLLLFYPN